MRVTESESMKTLLKRIQLLPDDASPAAIDETAHILRGMNYSPMLLLDTPAFLNFTKDDLIKELTRIRNLPVSDLNRRHLELLVYNYELLQRLRKNEPEAWDIVNELYEDD